MKKEFDQEVGGDEIPAGGYCRRGNRGVEGALRVGFKVLGGLVLLALLLPFLIPVIAVIGGLGLGLMGLILGLVLGFLGIALKIALLFLKLVLGVVGLALSILPLVLCVLGVVYLLESLSDD